MKSFEKRLYESQTNPLALQAVNVILRRIYATYGDEIADDLIQLNGAILRLVEISHKLGSVDKPIKAKSITK